jgi:hypothetical protein
MKTKTRVRAGILTTNHNETLVRDKRRKRSSRPIGSVPHPEVSGESRWCPGGEIVPDHRSGPDDRSHETHASERHERRHANENETAHANSRHDPRRHAHAIPGNPFPALHTYRRDGTMLDAGAPPLSRRRSRAVPLTASGSARAIGPFASASASSVLLWLAFTPAPLKSHSNEVLYRETTLRRMKSLGLVPSNSLLPVAI